MSSSSTTAPLSIPDQLQNAEHVRSILLEETAGPRPACAQCRIRETDLMEDAQAKMLKCSRCRVAHYCSSSCQKKHFGFHKHACRYAAQLRTNLEQGRGNLPIGGNETERQYQDFEISSILTTLGDHLVQMGYRESDTIQNGSAYYRQALIHYVQILPLGREAFFHPLHDVEDKILLLLVLLGGEEDALKQWTQHTGSPRRFAYDDHDKVPSTNSEKLSEKQGDQFDVPFHMIGKMLVLMKKLARFQQQNPDAAEEEEPHRKEIEGLIEGLRSNGKGEYLVKLRDKIPLDPMEAPELFRGGPYDKKAEQDQEHPAPPTIREFWLLYQDCFFLTPGLNSVLHEFVPEEY